MSTTIETRRTCATRLLLGASLVLALWFSLMALATLIAEPARSVVVFAPASAAVRALAHSDALIVGGGTGFMIAQGQRAGFVQALYAGGAWLVLPASPAGCRGSAGPKLSALPR